MEPIIITREEFLQRYWDYYLILEKDFLETERFLAIDEVNFDSYSNEYIKQYQTICSEIDVIAKSFCKEIDSHFRGSTIDAYCKAIIDNNLDFASRIITLKNRNIKLTPWQEWRYSIETLSNGNTRTLVVNPDWWKKYNKIKHTRTTINNETQLPYYKLSNQKNILNALAALYQLELYYYRTLHQRHFANKPDMPTQSKLFEIDNWGNKWVVLEGDLAFELG